MSGRADAASYAWATVPARDDGAGQQPRQSYLELGAMTSAVPSARLHARQVVREWGLPDLAETVELVVCELVTNAMQVSEGLNGSLFCGTWIVGLPSVRLWLEGSTRTVVVRVWGGSEAVPHTEKPDADIESGRGLMIVEALCARYGTYGVPGCSGKVVWGEVGRSQY